MTREERIEHLLTLISEAITFIEDDEEDDGELDHIKVHAHNLKDELEYLV